MSILTVQTHTKPAQDPPRWLMSPLAPGSVAVLPATATSVECAHLLREAIDHHRAESRRLAAAAKDHRNTLVALLDLRLQHAVELREAGWNPGLIAKAYRLTRERVRQLLAAAQPDDGAVA